MRICLVAIVAAWLRLCGGDAPPAGVVPPGAAVPGMPPQPAGSLPADPTAVPPAVAQPFLAPGAVPAPVAPTNVVAPPAAVAAPAAVTGVTEGPHHGSLLETAQAKFEIVTAGDGGLQVYVTDPAGAEIPLIEVALPVIHFALPEGDKLVVLRPGASFFEGTLGSRPAGPVSVRFDAAVRGVALSGITASIGTMATAEAPAPEEAEAPAPATSEVPAPIEAPIAVPEPSTGRPPQVSKAPPSGRRPRRGPQAQTFAPSPLAPAAPVRGDVVASPRPATPPPPPVLP